MSYTNEDAARAEAVIRDPSGIYKDRPIEQEAALAEVRAKHDALRQLGMLDPAPTHESRVAAYKQQFVEQQHPPLDPINDDVAALHGALFERMKDYPATTLSEMSAAAADDLRRAAELDGSGDYRTFKDGAWQNYSGAQLQQQHLADAEPVIREQAARHNIDFAKLKAIVSTQPALLRGWAARGAAMTDRAKAGLK
jgi:hypothetical protein